MRTVIKIVMSATLSFLFSMIGILASGCRGGGDVAPKLGVETDYQIGTIYQLKKPVYLFKIDRADAKEVARLRRLGVGGTPTNVREFREYLSYSVNADGLMMPGDRLKVVKFSRSKVWRFGEFLNFYATVVSGEQQGRMVRLSSISDVSGPGVRCFLDADYLEPEL
jgi:hypothetical protein